MQTLVNVSGTLIGWGKHYRFCNDATIFDRVDEYVDQQIRRLLDEYEQALSRETRYSRAFLGVGRLSEVKTTPLKWPRKKNSNSSH